MPGDTAPCETPAVPTEIIIEQTEADGSGHEPDARIGAVSPSSQSAIDAAEAFSAAARRAMLTPLDSDASHPAPAPVQPGEIELPYPREMVSLAAETFGALADASRAQIVAVLLVREMSVGDIAAAVGLTQSATSHHLRLLRDRRLVKFHRHGNQVYYLIDDVHVAAMFAEAFRHIRHVFERLPDHPYRLAVEPTNASR